MYPSESSQANSCFAKLEFPLLANYSSFFNLNPLEKKWKVNRVASGWWAPAMYLVPKVL